MPAIPKDKTVRVTVQPQVDKDLNNAGNLRHEMKKQLDKVKNNKPVKATYQPKEKKT